MFLTITAIISAVLFGAAFTIACQQSNKNNSMRCKIKELHSKLDIRFREVKDLSTRLERLCKANESKDADYFIGYNNDGNVTVIRRSFIKDWEYHVCIKSFTDEDEAFNLCEAEELCEMLNS